MKSENQMSANSKVGFVFRMVISYEFRQEHRQRRRHVIMGDTTLFGIGAPHYDGLYYGIGRFCVEDSIFKEITLSNEFTL